MCGERGPSKHVDHVSVSKGFRDKRKWAQFYIWHWRRMPTCLHVWCVNVSDISNIGAQRARCTRHLRGHDGLPGDMYMENEKGPLLSRGNRERACWATLLTHAPFLPCLAVLVYTMKRCETQYPLVVMVTPTVDTNTRQVLQQMGCIVRDVDVWHIDRPHEIMATERFIHVWTKLRAFELYEYDRVIMIDSDMLMCQQMDELFELELPPDTIASGLACTCNPNAIPTYPPDWTPENCGYALRPHPPPRSVRKRSTHHLMNSGTVVLRPSMRHSEAIHGFMREHAERIAQYRFPDQDLLADMYREHWVVLPWYYNALKTLRRCHRDLWNDRHVRIIHYILE